MFLFCSFFIRLFFQRMNRYLRQCTLGFVQIVLWLSVFFFGQPVKADTLPTDLKASLIVVSPGYTAYTAHGHCALRMQCMSEQLDFCFTYGLSDNTQSYFNFFSGKGMGVFSTAYTSEYLADYRQQGRQVIEYELNLNLDEKRSLWALLDSELADSNCRPYNYLKTNCSSMCVYAVNEALGQEHITYHQLPSVLTGSYRDFVRYISRHRPWISFFWLTLLADEGERQGDLADKLSPQLLADAWQSASIVDANGASRPMLVSSPRVIVCGDAGDHTSWFTPTLCFSLLFVLLCVLSMIDKRHPLSFMRYIDGALLLLHTLLSLFICYMSFFSSLIGASGSLYTIVFNPLPAILWLLFRKQSQYYKVFMIYSVVLAIFIMLTPFTPSVDLQHALFCAVFLPRCLSHVLVRRSPLLA